MKILFAGDSWAAKGYTDDNYDKSPDDFLSTDTRLADYWPVEYDSCFGIGRGNLYTLDRIVELQLPSTVPIVWVYSEPGRDWGRIQGRPDLEWLTKENYFDLRPALTEITLNKIRHTLKNPITFIGGLSDIDPDAADRAGVDVLHPSWQKWIATKLNSQWFKFGWGASDVGWRMHRDNVTPSRSLTFAWDELIREWCWWEEQGYFCHEHPTPLAHKEFAELLKPKLLEWLSNYGYKK